MDKDEWKVVGLITAMIVAVMLVFFSIAAQIEGANEREFRDEIYPAWVKATGNNNLTYDEWRILHRNRMLPGQYHNRK